MGAGHSQLEEFRQPLIVYVFLRFFRGIAKGRVAPPNSFLGPGKSTVVQWYTDNISESIVLHPSFLHVAKSLKSAKISLLLPVVRNCDSCQNIVYFSWRNRT
jgi:hypothetical protein